MDITNPRRSDVDERIELAAQARLSGKYPGYIHKSLKAAGYSDNASKHRTNQSRVNRRIHRIEFQREVVTPSVPHRLKDAGAATCHKFLLEKAVDQGWKSPWKTTAAVQIVNNLSNANISMVLARASIKRELEQAEDPRPTKVSRGSSVEAVLTNETVTVKNEEESDGYSQQLTPTDLFTVWL